MKRTLVIAALLCAALFAGAVLFIENGTPTAQSAQGEVDHTEGVRFTTVDVVLSSDHRLAAYEIELAVARGDADIVGVEGGVAPLDQPPYYDPEALSGGRIILAAFSTHAALPVGRHRVATVHLRERGGPVDYRVTVRAAADADGGRRPATASVEPSKEPQ